METENKKEISSNLPVIGSGDTEMPIGYRCPRCGNEVSLEESDYGDAILCNRCDNGEYTTMEPVFDSHCL